MSRPIRYQPEEWSVFFVTGRCIYSFFLIPLAIAHTIVGVCTCSGALRVSCTVCAFSATTTTYCCLRRTQQPSPASCNTWQQHRQGGPSASMEESSGDGYYASVVLDDAARRPKRCYGKQLRIALQTPWLSMQLGNASWRCILCYWVLRCEPRLHAAKHRKNLPLE